MRQAALARRAGKTFLDRPDDPKNLAEAHFPDAEKIVLVQDNLNTHCPASLYEAFPAAEARGWSSGSNGITWGRVCISNNAAERGLRGVALGRKSWLFCGSDRGGQRAAAMYSLIVTAKMNLSGIAGHPMHLLDELLPWNWRPQPPAIAALAA